MIRWRSHDLTFRIINVLFWSIAAESFCGDLKLFGAVAKAHETEHPEDHPNGFCRYVLDGPHINRLGIVSQPVPKVDPLDIEFPKFLTASSSGHEDVKQSVFNVSMTPILSFNPGNGR